MDELASLILRRYDGTHPQHKLVSLPSSLIDRPEELARSCVPCSCYSCRGEPWRIHGRWHETPGPSEDLVEHRGESRLAMALEGGDVRVRPHETCQSRSVALSVVKRAKTRQKTRQIPRRLDLPQSGCPTASEQASEQHRSGGRSWSRSRSRSREVKRSPKAVTGYRLDLQGI